MTALTKCHEVRARLEAKLTAANERIRELEDVSDEYKQLHGFAVKSFTRVVGQLTAEREVADKLEKALKDTLSHLVAAASLLSRIQLDKTRQEAEANGHISEYY